MASFPNRFLHAVLFACWMSLASVGAIRAQNAAKEEKLADPEDITRETKDGVSIKMTYFAGSLGKKSVPLILLHGWDGQRGDMEKLALRLQALGHAVVTLDLRGHGESLHIRGLDKELDRKTFGRRELDSMTLDIEAAKKFLLEKNNAGACNIEALGLVASDVSCLVAMRWAILDWAAPILPAFKQGQDVKAIVLLSPPNSFKGMNSVDFISNPITRKQISVMMVAGLEDTKALAESKRLHGRFQQYHFKPSGDNDLDRKNLDLFLVTPETQLDGSKLLTPALRVIDNVANFVNLRLAEKQEAYSWSDRKNPLQ